MRIRSLLAATALAAVATLPLAGAAHAEPTDRDCRDFASQAAAQSALNSHSGDPERLDRDKDGKACDEYFDDDPDEDAPPPPPGPGPEHPPVKTVPDRQILVKPHGAPDTGDGSVADGPTTPTLLLVGGLAAAGALGAAAARRQARR